VETSVAFTLKAEKSKAVAGFVENIKIMTVAAIKFLKL